ncbi:nucleolar complex protein 4 homolog B-like isoform X1 [Uloborus diversus]|uniref:nucleolar complex protein 4 homolog B-like isoform X1 n=2 Tax=Uloborus diversus TaxID=327109 RepID=UPI0024093B8C|nr:nucleolar complex protein 4 homolog B-like isoform X1 [Uloborus diversus]
MKGKLNNIVPCFLESRKNSNCILELEEFLLSEEESIITDAIDVTKELFSNIFSQAMLRQGFNAGEVQEKYRLWLFNRYEDYVGHLLSYLSHPSSKIRESALDTLLTFVKLEKEYPIKVVDNGKYYFPRNLFQKIIKELLSYEIDQQKVILRFQNCTSSEDNKFYLLKCMQCTLESSEKLTDVFIENTFHLLRGLEYPEEFSNSGVQGQFGIDEKKFSKLFSSVWRRFLKFQLPPVLFRKVLMCLDEGVLPHLQNPCVMTDFLTNAYNKGGITSLLSLNGLFLLMQKYNVEYPDFYKKLYALFSEKIVNGKLSARFFYLSNLFLSSTHLPAYVVASFAKKLSRISLMSRTDTLMKIVPFVCNLLIRHPTLNVLIHRNDPKSLSCDPFNFDETDPSASKAIDSSLWELKALQNHLNPVVSSKAKVINSNLPKLEYDISGVLNVTLNDVYQKERKRKFSEMPLATKKPCMENVWIFDK